jgi:hypothetical protein
MNVALTGATGFIGSHVLAELQAHGHEVLALVPDDDRRYHALRRRQPQNRRAFVVEGRRTRWLSGRRPTVPPGESRSCAVRRHWAPSTLWCDDSCIATGSCGDGLSGFRQPPASWRD